LFLASVQLARGFANNDELWGTVAQALRDRAIQGSKWYKKVVVALEERGLKQEVWGSPTAVIAERKDFGVKFSQYCFHSHLNIPRGSSADEIRDRQPFGIYPFLLRTPPGLSRFLFSFILSNWRWLDRGQCSNYPQNCTECDVYNSSYHLLFDCSIFAEERRCFLSSTGVPFSYEVLTVDDALIAREAAILGKKIFFRLSEMT
jgi:hypothetical protein